MRQRVGELPLLGEALGHREVDERVRRAGLPVDGAPLEVSETRFPALRDVERLGAKEDRERVVVGAERLGHEIELREHLARLVRRARASQAILESAREELRRAARRRERGGFLRVIERGLRAARAGRGLRRLDEPIAALLRALGRRRGQRDERLRDGLEVALLARELAEERQRPERTPAFRATTLRAISSAAGRIARAPRRRRGATSNIAPRARSRPSRASRGARYTRHRAREVALSLEEIAEVAERALVVRPLGGDALELLGRLLQETEALLEDRRAPQAHDAQHLAAIGEARQPLGALREVIGEARVIVLAREQLLDREVGLFVVGSELEDAVPRGLDRREVARLLVRVREPAEHGGARVALHARLDLVERLRADRRVAGERGDALELAPALERARVEERRRPERLRGGGDVAATLAKLRDLEPRRDARVDGRLLVLREGERATLELLVAVRRARTSRGSAPRSRLARPRSVSSRTRSSDAIALSNRPARRSASTNARCASMRRFALTFFSKRSRGAPVALRDARSAARTSSSSSLSRSAAAMRHARRGLRVARAVGDRAEQAAARRRRRC